MLKIFQMIFWKYHLLIVKEHRNFAIIPFFTFIIKTENLVIELLCGFLEYELSIYYRDKQDINFLVTDDDFFHSETFLNNLLSKIKL